MKICVINGSPKGKYSITLQSILYLEKLYPQHDFDILNVGQQIQQLENNFTGVINYLRHADLIIFAYPVYTFLVPSQLHRFIELIKEYEVDLEDTFVTQFTTSKHFYDSTAHEFIKENCFDLKMKYIKGLSSDMDDLTTKKGQQDLVNFFDYVTYCMSKDVYQPIPKRKSLINIEYPKNYTYIDKKIDKDVVIVSDLKNNDENLKNMIDHFQSIFPYKTRLVNLRDFKFSGGCLGCFNCASDGKCIYKDKFDEFLRNEIQNADGIVLAFTIKDHSMGSLFKMYDDRQFCNGHRTVTEGKPFGYIVNGDYLNEPNLKNLIDARSEVGGNFLSGVGYNKETLLKMSDNLIYALESNYSIPRNFYGVGGGKIFRDLIWTMQGIMKEDHKYYKKNKIYDFPYKKFPKMLGLRFIGIFISNKKIKAKMGNKLYEYMLFPYKKVLNKLDKKLKKDEKID